ncbi:MAG: hypothetical protein QME51_07900, partial [Planctomycetota bacterium]|nr:hypothetical protein [Planctomycetota bacterium]
MRRIVWLGLVITVLGVVYIGLGAKCPLDKKDKSGSSTPIEQHNFWRPITSENAPSLRIDHTTVWTGSPAEGGTGKMIIWGGRGRDLNFLNTGGIYDTILDTWTTITATAPPMTRGVHTAIWTGSKMIIWGGVNSSDYLPLRPDRGGIYDPTINIWTIPTATNAPVFGR